MLLKPAFLAAALAVVAPAGAVTLTETIAAAYAANPQIAAARAQLRQVDEGVPLAKVGQRPQLATSANGAQYLDDNFRGAGRLWSVSLGLQQSIYEGGRVRAGVSAAEARIMAARARLVAVEQQVIVDTVAAYADVLRMQWLLQLNESQVRVLQRELQASSDRFEVGDVTRTDVAQSEARLASARANVATVRAQLTVAQQAFERLVGMPPDDLAPLPPLPDLPPSPERSRLLAREYNPDLIASRFEEKAASEDVRLAKNQRWPSIGVSANAEYTKRDSGLLSLDGFNPRIAVSASMPLTTGGQIAAQVRRAQARQSELVLNISQTERVVTQNAINSFANVRAAQAVIESARTQVSANALAAEGVRQENLVGSRDILDVLNAEQELLNSRVALVQAERDRYVAAFELLEAVGQADIVLDGAPVERFDPTANSRRVAGKWGEFSYDLDPRLDRDRDTVPLAVPAPAPEAGLN